MLKPKSSVFLLPQVPNATPLDLHAAAAQSWDDGDVTPLKQNTVEIQNPISYITPLIIRFLRHASSRPGALSPSLHRCQEVRARTFSNSSAAVLVHQYARLLSCHATIYQDAVQ